MRNLFFISLISIGSHIFAQTKDTPVRDKKFSIGLSAGVSVPVFDYAHKTINKYDTSQINGFANTGVHFNVSISYRVFKHIGIMLMAGESINSFNTSSYAIALNDNSSGGNYTSQNIHTSGSHYVGQYFVGPYFSFPVRNKFSVELHLLAGMMTSIYPKISENQSFYSFYTINGFTKYNNGKGFGINLGVGVKYMFCSSLGVMLNVAYSGSNMVYSGYSTSFTYNPSPSFINSHSYYYTYSYSSGTNKNMVLGMFNYTGGLVFSF